MTFSRKRSTPCFAASVEEKEALTRQVGELKKTAQEYRARFEELLQAQQEALEKASDLFFIFLRQNRAGRIDQPSADLYIFAAGIKQLFLGFANIA